MHISNFLYAPKSRTARVFVHFHSRSVVALESLMTRGTQPPNTYILFAIIVELCRERGNGACPRVRGFSQVIESAEYQLGCKKMTGVEACYIPVSSNHKSPSRQPLIPP